MSNNQLFIATHQQASDYARGKGQAPAELVELGEISDFEIEALAELAVKTVHATGTETSLSLVDVDLDELLAFPDALTEVFAELPGLEDQEEVSDLAVAWANSEEFDAGEEVATRVLAQISGLAVRVVGADEDARLAIYYLQR